MLNIFYRIYQKKLEKEVLEKTIPDHIAVVVDGANSDELFDGLMKFVKWSKNCGVRELTFAINGFDDIVPIKELAENINTRVKLIFDSNKVEFGVDDNFTVNLLINLRGKKEIIDAVRELANCVRAGKIDPDRVDEDMIERHLKISSEPDVIIRASLRSLDFLIWQSIYSEHVFFDIDWKNLRYIDFLRILREYQKRERRYGR